jgi:hypothetical protein
MAFATNNDIEQYAPEVFDQGVEDWSDELALAETDVSNFVQIRWFNKHHSKTNWDKTKLTDAQWNRATVYRALYAHIMPKLSTFRPEGDPFREQIIFYRERFEEEMDIQFGLGIQYDDNNDGIVTDGETEVYKQNRLRR